MSDPIDMTGPWEAVAFNPDGDVIAPDDPDEDLFDCRIIAVVRRTAGPSLENGAYLRNGYDPADVLYLLDDLDDDPDQVPRRYRQAVLVAEALNTAYPTNGAT